MPREFQAYKPTHMTGGIAHSAEVCTASCDCFESLRQAPNDAARQPFRRESPRNLFRDVGSWGRWCDFPFGGFLCWWGLFYCKGILVPNSLSGLSQNRTTGESRSAFSGIFMYCVNLTSGHGWHNAASICDGGLRALGLAGDGFSRVLD